MPDKNEIIDNLKVICQCNGIKKGVFKKLIADGERRLPRIRKLTGAGSGSCGGKRCGARLTGMLEQGD